MPEKANRIFAKMLDRLFAAMANGPSLNCKPHSSRQRIDLTQFAKLQDRTPDQLFLDLLGEARSAKVVARVAPAKKVLEASGDDSELTETAEEKLTPEEKAARAAWLDQQALMRKLRAIAEEARTYENDTGVSVLQVGYPLLSLPPGSFGLQRSSGRRILAPLAFIAVSLTIRAGGVPAVLLECRNRGEDLVMPNTALLAWLEQQTDQVHAELFADPTGEQPWQEIAAIVRRVAQLTETSTPETFAAEINAPPPLWPAPKSDGDEHAKPTILNCAVLGLFPAANQGLLRDMQALVGGEPAPHRLYHATSARK